MQGRNIEDLHPHGIQSETNDTALKAFAAPPGVLRANNQATGYQSAVQNNRDPICMTNEGVRDLAGHLSEWVLNDYTSN